MADTPKPKIVEFAREQWGVSPRTVDTLIQRAKIRIAETAAEMRESAMDRHLAQRAQYRHLAAQAGDIRLASEILRDESKLLDLYPTKKITQTNIELDIDWEVLTVDQIRRIAAGESAADVLSNRGRD
jgi:hypothetical protein